MRNLLALLVVVSALGVAGCGSKDEVMDASPVATQTPKGPPMPKANKPLKFSAGSTSDQGTAAPVTTQ